MFRERGRSSFDIFVVFSTLILSGGWRHGISFFFLLFEGKRRRGEFKIGLIVLAKSNPRGAFHHVAFVFAVYLVDELVPVFLMLLEEVRILR